MKKVSELYVLNHHEIILLELFNLMDSEQQREKLYLLAGYLTGGWILSDDEALEYLKRIKKD